MNKSQTIDHEQILLRPIKLTIKRKSKPDLRIYFESTGQLNLFNWFLKDLIKNVKEA